MSRRYLDEHDHDVYDIERLEEAAALRAYEAWLERRWPKPDLPDDAFDPGDPSDLLEIEDGRL